jgi:hypothetical protein
VFEHKGKCYRSGITFHPATRQYLWCQILPGEEPGPRFKGGFGVYSATEPWGPWRTVYYTEEWDVGPGETSHFPTMWMSPDGRTAWLLFSGDDCFSLRKATLRLSDGTHGGGPLLDGVREHLTRKYDPKRDRSRPGDLAFLPKASLARLELPSLRRSAPGHWFYLTELETGHHEYPTIRVIVAARSDSDGQLTTTELLATDYMGLNPDFLAQFRGLAADDRRALAREIAELFRLVTHSGVLASESFADDRYGIDLWINSRYWRYRVVVTFNRTGAVDGVELKTVKSTDQEWRNRPAGIDDR